MNKNFIALDKETNSAKESKFIIKLNYENQEYIVYSLKENEENDQIFVSKFILNSEGRHFIDNITNEEKEKLSKLAYNIVIVIPSENEGNSGNSKMLVDDFCTKNNVNLSLEIADIGDQEYLKDCMIAITKKEIVNNAINFYNNVLTVKEEINNNSLASTPTWSIPSAESTVNDVQTIENNTLNDSANIVENSDNSLNTNNISIEYANSNINDDNFSLDNSNNALNEPNPQAQKLAVMSDPSMEKFGVNVDNTQPNLGKKNAGFASNKYVVIGTICLVLAVAVVVIAYFLIRNLK